MSPHRETAMAHLYLASITLPSSKEKATLMLLLVFCANLLQMDMLITQLDFKFISHR
jgi:hypothetical protein